MEPLTNKQKVAKVRRHLGPEVRKVFPAIEIIGAAERLGDGWHLAGFDAAVAQHLTAMYEYRE